jgi:eukaryotic-like serine/threonine-protein kinase
MVGRTFANGRYEVLEQVGEGGAALVHRGHDHHLGRDVAIKVLRPELAGDPEFAERFRREATAAAGLCHPNIAQVYDIGWDANASYMVMELVPGGTLRDRLQRSGALAPEEALRVASEVAGALQHAHESGIVHRDIKPHNILFTRDGNVKVLDFGIARALAQASISQTGTIVGSVHYLSPEQARGEPAMPQSDIYSLGVVLFEMLTGRVPFDADTPVAVAVRHMQEIAPDVRSLNPQVPAAVAAIVQRALAKDLGDRFRNALAMQQELERVRGGLLAGGPVAAGSATLADQATRRIQRPPVPPPVHPSLRSARTPIEQPLEPEGLSGLTWALVALTILVVAAGIGVLVWANSPRKAPVTGQAGQATADQKAGVQMPDLTGSTSVDAKNRLRRQGIDDAYVVTEQQKSEGTPASVVMGQRPAPGAMWYPGDRIVLTVSSGPSDEDKLAIVPECLGLVSTEATKLLIKTKLIPKVEMKEPPGDEEENTVFDQSPPPGSSVKTQTEVRIYVAKRKPKPDSTDGAGTDTGGKAPTDGGTPPPDGGKAPDGNGGSGTPGNGGAGGTSTPGGNGRTGASGSGTGETGGGGTTTAPRPPARKPGDL